MQDSCGFEFFPPASAPVLFDLSRACMATGSYSAVNAQTQDDYVFNICANATEICVTANQTGPSIGAVLVYSAQFAPPPCPNVTESPCRDPPTGRPVCCSRPCAVVAVGMPSVWDVANPGDPHRGGIKLDFTALPTSNDSFSQTLCMRNSINRAPHFTQTSLLMECTYGRAVTRVDHVEVDVDAGPELCAVRVVMSSPHACAMLRLSVGWAFIVLLLVGFGIYVLVGMAINLIVFGECSYPSRRWWSERGADIGAGWSVFWYFGSCCCFTASLRAMDTMWDGFVVEYRLPASKGRDGGAGNGNGDDEDDEDGEEEEDHHGHEEEDMLMRSSGHAGSASSAMRLRPTSAAAVSSRERAPLLGRPASDPAGRG